MDAIDLLGTKQGSYNKVKASEIRWCAAIFHIPNTYTDAN